MMKSTLALLLGLMLIGCGKKSDSTTKTAAGGDAERGRAIYLSNCAACHNNDPSKDGPIGPGIKGASRELVEARVLRASYPAGYKPKRNTQAMPPQPYLKDSVPDLVAFLNQP
jgi:mono/diheme cytochrome c family protein